MPKKLMLHIGHPKTGSSFLQSVLALNNGLLAEHGFNYLDHGSNSRASHGEITSGNGDIFHSFLEDHSRAATTLGDIHVFSKEKLFFDFTRPDFQGKFTSLIEDGFYDEIGILLYIRDPVSWRASAFQQNLKRGSKGAIDVSLMFEEVVLPIQVNQCLDFFEQIPIVTVKILNYVVVRSSLLNSFADWLGIDERLFVSPEKRVINRSMTSSELMLLTVLKNFRGEVNNFVSSALCQQLPDVEADVILPSLESQNTLWDRLSTQIDRANARIEPEQRYDRARDIQLPKNYRETAEFSRAQIGVIADCIATLNQRLNNSHRHNLELSNRLAETRERNVAMLAQIEDLRARIVKLRGDPA